MSHGTQIPTGVQYDGESLTRQISRLTSVTVGHSSRFGQRAMSPFRFRPPISQVDKRLDSLLGVAQEFEFGIATAIKNPRVLGCSGRTPIRAEIQQKSSTTD